MRALIIGEVERAAIAKLKEAAATNPFDPASVIIAADKDMLAWRDFMKTMTVAIPFGYHVTYSHERQPIGLVHHISMSIETPSMMPSPEAVEMILQEFGMKPMRTSVGLWIENVGSGLSAINLVQPV